MFENFNKRMNSTIAEGIELKNLPIIKLKEAQTSKLLGFYISKDAGYGRSVLLVTEKNQIALPKRYVEQFQNMNEEEVEALKSGEWFIANISEVKAKLGNTYTFDLVHKKDL